MNFTTYVAGNTPSASSYNGIQQQLVGWQRILGRLLGDTGGVVGVLTSNGQVQEASPQHASQIRVLGPTLVAVPLTTPTLNGVAPFFKDATEVVAVPALNTIAGQSRNDLVIARVNVGQVDAYVLEVTQGTPATTGSQTDPTVPINSYKLARITRAHGAGVITNAMITDLRVRAAATP